MGMLEVGAGSDAVAICIKQRNNMDHESWMLMNLRKEA